MGIVLTVTSVIAICAFLLTVMSTVWLKFNEFHEMMFPEMKKYSSYIFLISAVLSLGLYITSNINIQRQIKENRDLFISAYSEYPRYVSLNVTLEADVSEQIALLKSGSRRYGQYRAIVLSIDDQLRTDLSRIRSGDKQLLLDWYGTSDIKVNEVYLRSDYDSLTDLQLKEQADNGGYEFELYYTDANKRKQAEEKYKALLKDDSLVKSYMTQFDTDRSFDVTEKFKVNVDNDGNIIVDDKMKEFIKKNESMEE